MDDEQGPWWTRPPEPGPQTPVAARPPGDDEEPDDGIVTPRPASASPVAEDATQAWVPQQLGGRPGGEPDEAVAQPLDAQPLDAQPLDAPPVEDQTPAPFETWGGGFTAPPAGTNAWDAHPGLFAEPPAPERPTAQPTERPAPPEEPSLRDDETTVVPPGSLFAPQPPPETEAPAPSGGVVPPSPIMSPRPQVRRVAVVDPNPPPRVDPNDRTETLPALGDDIFAVFDAQSPPRPGAEAPRVAPFDPYTAAPAQDDPLGHLRDEPQSHRLHVPHLQMPEPRFLLMAVGSGLVVLLVLLVVLLFGKGGDEKPPVAAPVQSASKATAPALVGKTPAGLKKLSDGQAADLLAKAGENGKGQIVEAWSWNDQNGRNVVVSTTEVRPGNRKTLRVIHVADLDGDPHTLRVMTDPNLPDCKNPSAAGTAGFTDNAMMVRDVDGDGVAEVTAGWTSRCGAKTGTSEIKLAMISDGKKFIIRDTGVVGQAGAGTPDPKSGSWPDGYYSALTKLYKKLYS